MSNLAVRLQIAKYATRQKYKKDCRNPNRFQSKSEGIHLIGMYKIAKTKFMYHGKILTNPDVERLMVIFLESKRNTA